MPWEIRRQGGQHCVVKIADGGVVACHATAAKANAQLRALYASEGNAAVAAMNAWFAREGDVNLPGASHNLRDYWTRGPGAAKIRWNTEGDGTRCIKLLSKYVRDPGGLCQEYHRRATGKSMHPHPGRLVEAGDMEEFDVDVEAKGFDPSLHPHDPSNGRFVKTLLKHIKGSRDIEGDPSIVSNRDIYGKPNISERISERLNKMRKLSAEFADGNSDEPYGDVTYADPGYRGRKRYPIDTEQHIRAAWSYINMPKNASKYTAEQLSAIKSKIKKAMTGTVGANVEAVAEWMLEAHGTHNQRSHGNWAHPDGPGGGRGRGGYLGELKKKLEGDAGLTKKESKEYDALKKSGRGDDGGASQFVEAMRSTISNEGLGAKVKIRRRLNHLDNEELDAVAKHLGVHVEGLSNDEVKDQIFEKIHPRSGKTYATDVVTAAGNGCPPGQHKMTDGSCMADADMLPRVNKPAQKPTQAYADEPWEGPLVVEGTESGDGRIFSVGALDWAALPMPLMYQPANVGGHNSSILVGEITHAARKGTKILGRGNVFGHVLAGEHGEDVRQMIQTGGVSVDVDKVKDADVELVYADDPDGEPGNPFGKPETTIFNRGRIRGATLVAFPAFVEAKLAFVNEQEPLTASAEDCGCGDLLVAAAHTITIPNLPKASWFNEPTDVQLHGALTITDEGRVYGIVAPAGVTHRNVPTQVPRNLDFTRFHKGETIVEGGSRVVTGVITADCGHAPTQNYGTLQARMDHYDNSCSVLANVRVGYRGDGTIWMAGALNAGAQPHQVAQALGCALSLDKQPHPDRPGVSEFIAAHLVPVPGFPKARTLASATYEDGVVVASSVPVRHAPTRALDDVREAKLAIAARFGLDPASRKKRAYAKMKMGRMTCALADVVGPRS